MKNDRLFQLVYILLEKQRVTAPELARQLEVSVRTIYRDIETLSIAGVPIYAAAGKGGGISLLPGFTFDKSLLTDKEQDQILFALQSVQAADPAVDSLLFKLGKVFQKTNTDWIKVDFSRWGCGETDTTKFEQLKKSILEKHIIHISYCGTNGRLTDRNIKPVRLVFKDKNWYLQGFCLKANDFRIFKISRIIELSLLRERFDDTFTEIPDLEGETSSDDLISLVLKFAPEITYRVYDEFDISHIQKQADGSIVVMVDLPYDGWIFSCLLSFGTMVEVLEPAYFKEELARYMKKIYEHYIT